MQRVGLINWNNIIYDHDLTAWLLASLSSWVIEWFWINSENILPGKALIECYRSNWQKILVNFESTSNEAFDLTGTKSIYIQIDQSKIDNGSSNNEDGSWIWSIISNSSFPVTDYNWIPLYSIVDWVVTDERIPVKSKLARTRLTPYRLCIIDQDGNETFLEFGENWQSLVSWWPEALPSWVSPTVNIVGLTEKLIPADDDFVILSDSEDDDLNKKIKFSNIPINYNYLASTDYQTWLLTEVTHNTNTATKKKEAKVVYNWTIKVSFQLRASWVSWVNWRIYINWTAVWTQRSTALTSYQTYVEDFTVKAWDLIQLYIWLDGSWYTVYTTNFKLGYDIIKTNLPDPIITLLN